MIREIRNLKPADGLQKFLFFRFASYLVKIIQLTNFYNYKIFSELYDQIHVTSLGFSFKVLQIL